MNRRVMTFVLVALAAVAAHAAETTVETSRAIVLPPPKVELPPLPADGSGIWRLHLEDWVPAGTTAPGPTPLWIILEVDQGKIVRAAAAPVHQKEGQNNDVGIGAWGTADGGHLTITPQRLNGRLTVNLFPMWDNTVHMKSVQGKPNKAFKSYKMEPMTPELIEIEVALDGHRGAGSWRRTQGAETTSRQKPPEKGLIALWREPALPATESYDLEFFMPGALGNLDQVPVPALRLRARMSGKGLSGATGWMTIGRDTGSEVAGIAWNKAELTNVNGRVKGRFEGTIPKQSEARFALDVEGQCIGRNLFGTVTLHQGDHVLTTPLRGLMDIVSWNLPIMDKDMGPHRGGSWNGPAWNWRHDLKPDPELAAAVLEESSLPVLPGEPGRAGFWTWRTFVKGGMTHVNTVSVIYPPCFDLEETPGAAKYRFTLKANKAPVGKTPKTVAFETDKPWRPLAPVWKEMPPGVWTLTVTALDAAGKELPGPMRVGVGERQSTDKTPLVYLKPEEIAPPRRVVIETKPIVFEKRPCFAGPYSSPPARSWIQAALTVATWDHSEGRAHQGLMGAGSLSRRGLAPSLWQDTNNFDNHPLWSELALRALSGDAGLRLQAEQMIRFWFEEDRLHQRRWGGIFTKYFGYAPLAHWGGEMLLDAWMQTGDPAWKEQCREFGRGLVKLQNANGSFRSVARGHIDGWEKFPQEPLPGPEKYAYWSYSLSHILHYIQGGASELLYVLGRLRRDLQTDEFTAAERLAYRWMMEVAVRERYFPLYVHHSASHQWPQTQHSVSALYICRYLLECAPPGQRDVQLAEELARWAEDYRVDWTRAADGQQQGRVTPRIDPLDRCNNEPVAINLLAAIVFERLGQETGNRLWTAKGEALATAVLVAMNPENGYLDDGLDTTGGGSTGFCRSWAVQLLREYAALKEAKK